MSGARFPIIATSTISKPLGGLAINTITRNHYANWDGNYTEDGFDLIINSVEIGTLWVGYLAPFYFNEEEL